MPPRKNRPVLYEVVSRTQRPRGGSRRGPEPPVRPVSQPLAPVPEQAAQPGPRAEPSAPSDSPRIEDGRIRLELGWPRLLVIVAALVVLLVVAYRAGVRSALAPAEGPDELSDILAQPVAGGPPAAAVPTPGRGRDGAVATPAGPGTRAGGGEQARPGPPASRQPTSPGFTPTPGAYYVLVQYYPRRNQAAAEAGRDFLRSNGVATVVVEGHGDWRLVATQAFESAAQAQTLLRRIRELGTEYSRSGGGYDFAGADARRF